MKTQRGKNYIDNQSHRNAMQPSCQFFLQQLPNCSRFFFIPSPKVVKKKVKHAAGLSWTKLFFLLAPWGPCSLAQNKMHWLEKPPNLNKCGLALRQKHLWGILTLCSCPTLCVTCSVSAVCQCAFRAVQQGRSPPMSARPGHWQGAAQGLRDAVREGRRHRPLRRMRRGRGADS